MSPIIYECTGKIWKCKITFQDKFAQNSFTQKNRDNFAPFTCQNVLRFVKPKSNSQNLFETNIFLSDLSPNIVFPCHLLLLTHSLRTVVETWLMWVWLMSKVLPIWWSYLGNVGKLKCTAVVAEVWSTFWSWAFVKILRLKFGLNFEAEILSRFSSWLKSLTESAIFFSSQHRHICHICGIFCVWPWQ